MQCVSAVLWIILCLYLAALAQSRMISQKPPSHCILNPREAFNSYTTVEEYDECAPYLVWENAREYYLACGIRNVTCTENKNAYKRLRILPKVLRDVSNTNLEVTVLGDKIRFPICASPTALQKLASKLGEIDNARAINNMGTLMILSSYGSTSIEDVARAAPTAIKWMQTYIFRRREITIDIVRRAEAAGFKAIVVTVDAPVEATVSSRASIVPNPQGVTYANQNLNGSENEAANPSLTFEDLQWLKGITRLHIIAKGILTADDAVKAAHHGVSAILVSNHGGRQLDYDPATIDALPAIADAIKNCCPGVEVYVDGGVRNGFDVFKALARGARAVFVGRPVLWGLAVQGERGVAKVFDILKNELNETMILAGTPNVDSIGKNMVVADDSYLMYKN